ncbi:MAG: Rid family hydrolase [Prevotella sp.]|nr:Rid family hydrolase [Bacteroides sp.]MCM1367131.1 Rid family hydrolase [Prevotella sp.]MCM1437435.1 Rid family hydrolase [Prevotella sp.]
MINKKTLVSSDGRREIHAIITVSNDMLTFEQQINEIKRDFSALSDDMAEGIHPVFMRWFLSDSANQAAVLPKLADCAVSIVEQPPLSLTKAALWVWLIEGESPLMHQEGIYKLPHGKYTSVFESGRCRPGKDSEAATYDVLMSTEKTLNEHGVNLLKGCVRTWFFVQNVDVNYQGVVEGRNKAFAELGLIPRTRFIASTGIGGRHSDKSVTVQMDSYSESGLDDGQMRQINAPEYLNPTYEYGVAFERATSVDYGDRRHLFISGTASIDNKGNVVWEHNISRQTLRMLTNVEALLNSGGCEWGDVGQILVYLRDPADYAVVKEIFDERFPETPFVILIAPVCRPGWLIEMECMAMKGIDSEYEPY